MALKSYFFHSRQNPGLGIVVAIEAETQDDFFLMFVYCEKLLEVIDGVEGHCIER